MFLKINSKREYSFDYVLVCMFNQFKPNGISHSYQLDESISVLRVVEWYFSFLFKF